VLAKSKHRNLLILLSIWLAGVAIDRLWFACDRSVPDWDRAEYLTSSLNYWRSLQQPQWFSGDWWVDFWQLSTKAPPLTQIAAAVTQLIFGTGYDRATLVNSFFSAILLTSVYGLGIQLFSAEVGLWAAGLCQLIPGLYQLRLDFLLDYPLTAVVALCFCCLTVWRKSQKLKVKSQNFPIFSQSVRSWLWAIAFGISLGMALLVKQTALFFLFAPIVWAGVEVICQRNIKRICQFAIALLFSVAVFAPWYRTNWLLILTGGKRATIDSALAEGDPALNTLDAWTYYWKLLPSHISWVLLLVPIVGLLLFKSQKLKVKSQNKNDFPTPDSLIWVAVFLIGAYFLCSLNINKDSRYVVPYLPVVTLLLAYGMTRWRGRWGQQIRWATVGLAMFAMVLNLFPIGGVLGSRVVSIVSPHSNRHAYMGAEFPHEQVIEEIIQTAPYLKSNLGVLPSTLEVNQHNLNYFGALRNFQVYGRQVGTRRQQIVQDGRSLDWFLTKTGEQGSVPNAQTQMVQYVEQSPDFNLQKTWTLPDRSILRLYHRRVPQVEVEQEQFTIHNSQFTIQSTTSLPPTLKQVIVPPSAPPGKPIPVTYEWLGTWEQFQSGIVLMTWKNRDSNTPSDRWIHDRAIGMGNLIHIPTPVRAGFERGSIALTEDLSLNPPLRLPTLYSVTENLAMMPPTNASAGIYTLEATYLNRNTGETYSIAVPSVTLKIDPTATATPAPELDLITQERLLAATLPQGIKALERVFAEVGRIHQYDPTQNYLGQAQQALEYRLQQEPQNLDWAYALSLTQILQQKVAGAIAALERVTQLDSQNPYAYAYLAFVHLYNWNGAAAQTALKPALAIDPNIPELHVLHGVAALMQGNFIQAWQDYSTFRKSEQLSGSR
jgi:4-amino-4-deoxy-L-arabinose transferase-like glycosyltransferase